MYGAALTLHIAASVLWLGSLAYLLFLLEPMAGTNDGERRLNMWAQALRRLAPWTWMCILALIVTGFYLVHTLGGFTGMTTGLWMMVAGAVVMIALFRLQYAVPYPHLMRGIREQKWEVAEFALGTIRKLVAATLVVGILTTSTAFL